MLLFLLVLLADDDDDVGDYEEDAEWLGNEKTMRQC